MKPACCSIPVGLSASMQQVHMAEVLSGSKTDVVFISNFDTQ